VRNVSASLTSATRSSADGVELEAAVLLRPVTQQKRQQSTQLPGKSVRAPWHAAAIPRTAGAA
jgi:hypothetical protein